MTTDTPDRIAEIEDWHSRTMKPLAEWERESVDALEAWERRSLDEIIAIRERQAQNHKVE